MGKHFLFTSGSLWGESQGQQPARKPAGAWRWGQGEGGGAGWPGQQGANRGSRGLSLPAPVTVLQQWPCNAGGVLCTPGAPCRTPADPVPWCLSLTNAQSWCLYPRSSSL